MSSDRPTAAELVEHYGMVPLDGENIRFHQAWISAVAYDQDTPAGTAIVALLTDAPDSYSDLHSLAHDEIWHFYLGDPMELLLLHPDGSDELRILGPDVLAGQLIQTVVPAGSWMGARVRPGGTWTLFGNTMAPGFTPDAFEAADAEALVRRHPHHTELIRALAPR